MSVHPFAEALEYLLEHLNKNQTDPKAADLHARVKTLNDEERASNLAVDNDGDAPDPEIEKARAEFAARLKAEEDGLLNSIAGPIAVEPPAEGAAGQGAASATLQVG